MKPRREAEARLPRAPRKRLSLEQLEDRLNLATFSGAGAVLTINLTNAAEALTLSTNGTTITAVSNFNAVDGGGTGGNVAGFGTPSAAITSAGFTTINVIDSAAGTSISFAASTGAYGQTFGITLDDAASGNIQFTGNTTNTGNFSASTTNGTISSTATASFNLTGNLSLTGGVANSRDVLLLGSTVVTGTTTLNGLGVQADNASNDFQGAVSVNSGRYASIFDANSLIMGSSTFGQLSPSIIPQPTTRIAAGGNITQTGNIVSTAEELNVSSTGGSITLTSATNNIDRLALAVTGANTIDAFSLTGLTLGDVTADTGAITLATTNNPLNQANGTSIRTNGAFTVNVNAGNVNVNLNNANRILGAVTIAETGGDLTNVTFRNIADTALFPTIAALGTAGDVGTLTLTFDNNGIVVPAITPNNASFIAGGDITQAAPLNLTGTLTATILGDFGINLSNAANNIGSTVSISAADSTQPIQIGVTGVLNLTTSFLGRGAFTATATGNITGSGALIQRKGAAAATFNSGGTTASLGNASNDFTGNVVVTGATVNTIIFNNASQQARFDQLSFAGTATNALAYSSPNAAVLLPNLTMPTLTVSSLGISQEAGSVITSTGVAQFNANNSRLTLGGANDFATLSVNNSGRNDILVNDINDLTFNTSNVGTGRLTVTVGGNVTQQGATTITQAAGGPAGALSFSSTGGNINLGTNNTFRGRVNASVVGANTLTINCAVNTLTLGNITTGAGAFAAVSNPGIVQYPGSKLTLGGASSFNTVNTVTLDNKGNSFVGAVALSANTASLTGNGAVILASGNVTGNLSITTGGLAAHSVTQTGPVAGNSIATFNTGAGNITLTNAGNDFSQVRLNSTGTAVAVTDTNALAIGPSKLGGGTLTIDTGGNITSGGPVVQTTGSGAVTLTTPAANNITLNNAGNLFRGTITVTNSSNVNLRSVNDLTFAAASVVTGNLIGVAGGTITLPSDLTQINGLTLSAFVTTIASDVTITGGSLDITGTVNLTGNRVITLTTSNANIRGDINAGGSVTFNLAAGQSVRHQSGTWNQGANDLTVNGTGALLFLGGTGQQAFVMTGGNLNLPGNGTIEVFANGKFQVGTNAATAETVTINSGTGNVIFDPNSALQVGLGTTNDQLVVNGFGRLEVNGALLRTTGLAGTSASPVLTSQTAVLAGRFAGTLAPNGNISDVFTGSDIVTPTYTTTQLLLHSGGIVAASGTATGFLPDGDTFTVKTSLGAAGNLATFVDFNDMLYVAVRGTSAAAQTVTISTTGGGDGVLPVGGVMVHGTGATTIAAGSADFTGQLTTNGTLASLTARDLGAGSLLVLSAGGPATGSNKLTGRIFSNVVATFAGALTNFTVTAANNTNARITADKFGTIKTTGSLALGNLGDFFGTLISTTASTGQVLSSATIAGALTGTWDLRGSVGTIKSAKVGGWTLGTLPSSTAFNGGLLTNVTKLDLGDVVTGLVVNATGVVSSLSAFEIAGSGNVIRAAAVGTVSMTGNPTLGLAGSMLATTFLLSGNTGIKSQALGSLTAAGDISAVTITADNGNLGTIKSSRSILNTTITATDTGTLGNVSSISASKVNTLALNARSLSTMNVGLNLGAGLLGDVALATIRVTGNLAGVGIGTFAAAGPVSGSTWTSTGGTITRVTSARTISSSTLTVSDPTFGKLGTFQAASFSGVNATARTIDLINASGAKAVGPASQFILGTFSGGGILAYDETGTVASIKTLSTAGLLDTSTVQAERGITTLTVGRTLSSSSVVADDTLAGNATVGRIGTLNTGAITSALIAANTVGTIAVKGFATPELTPGSKVFGDITGGTMIVNGATPTKPVGVGSFTVERNVTSLTFAAPGGMTKMTVGGTMAGSTLNLENAANPASGFLTTLTTSNIDTTNIRVGTGGTWKVNSSPTLFLQGNVGFSTFTVLANATASSGITVLSALTIAGDFFSSTLDVAATVGSATVVGQVASAAQLNLGYASGASLKVMNVGTWGTASDGTSSRLASQSIGTFAVKGNVARGLAGFVRLGFFDVLGNAAGVGIGSFTATGTVSDSEFRVSDGDVTSFKVQRFRDSDLFVGFRPNKDNDLTAAGTWATVNRRLGLFQTTAPFDATDEADSSSFRNANVVAALLGTVTLSGVKPSATNVTAFGIGFRTAAGAAAQGTVKIHGSGTALTPAFTDELFTYRGLLG